VKKLTFKKLEIREIKQPAYSLSPIELKDYIDFEAKRFYFISKVIGGEKTGSHCHMEEKELFVMVSGICTAVIDQGNGLEEVPLTGPTDAIYVGNFVWHHFKDFSQDAVLLAVSSTNHNPDRSDYIEDYEEYRKVIEAK
jgi:uncharacterized cupin superfamily protein